jgi:hypothetical protein
MSTADFNFEQALPERVPPGERIIWQGSPQTLSLARRAFHVSLVAIYFIGLAAWAVASGLSDGEFGKIVASLTRITLVAATATSVLLILAWLTKRSATYMLTSERVVMRFGVALPMTVNIPFRYIAAADLKTYRDGTGDISLRLHGDRFLGFIHLWPHVRAWRLAKPEPELRAVPDAATVAAKLATALAAAQAAGEPRTDVEAATSAQHYGGTQQRPGGSSTPHEKEPARAPRKQNEPRRKPSPAVGTRHPAAA